MGPVLIAQFTTTNGRVNLPDPVSTLKTDVSTGFTIAFLLPFRSFLEIFSNYGVGIPYGAFQPFHIQGSGRSAIPGQPHQSLD